MKSGKVNMMIKTASAVPAHTWDVLFQFWPKPDHLYCVFVIMLQLIGGQRPINNHGIPYFQHGIVFYVVMSFWGVWINFCRK